MNILILSCGTRCLLVDYFMNRESGFDKVVVTDCSANSPALYRADKYYIVPRMSEPNYLPKLFNICELEGIDAVLPLQEDELILIADHAEEFKNRNVLPIISSLELVNLCRDKYSFYKKMEEIGVLSIPTGLVENKDEIIERYGFPIFMKPRCGAGSVSNMLVNNASLIDANVENHDEEFIVQPYIDGQEYGVNFYVDFLTGELTDLFIMEKIRMRAGETEKSMSVHDDEIERIVKTLCEKLPFRGPIDMDIMRRNNEYYVLEVNPRFGGGYPHTYSCGVDFIRKIAQNAAGIPNNVNQTEYEDGIVAFRYSAISLKRKDEMPNEKCD